MEDNREFVAFSRKLLRDFIQIKKLMEKGEYEKVKSMIDELIEDTQKDIETWLTLLSKYLTEIWMSILIDIVRL